MDPAPEDGCCPVEDAACPSGWILPFRSATRSGRPVRRPSHEEYHTFKHTKRKNHRGYYVLACLSNSVLLIVLIVIRLSISGLLVILIATWISMECLIGYWACRGTDCCRTQCNWGCLGTGTLKRSVRFSMSGHRRLEKSDT
jgi:hypothetical protein